MSGKNLLESEINMTKSMNGKKIIYKSGFLDNHFHGRHTNNKSEAEKMTEKLQRDITINSNFGNPYKRVDISAVKVKLIK